MARVVYLRSVTIRYAVYPVLMAKGTVQTVQAVRSNFPINSNFPTILSETAYSTRVVGFLTHAALLLRGAVKERPGLVKIPILRSFPWGLLFNIYRPWRVR